MKVDADFREFVAQLITDESLDDENKLSLLSGWEISLIETNANRIMSKEEAEKHFEWLDIINKAQDHFKKKRCLTAPQTCASYALWISR